MVKVKKNPGGRKPKLHNIQTLAAAHQGLLLQRASWRNDGEVCAAEAEGFCGA